MMALAKRLVQLFIVSQIKASERLFILQQPTQFTFFFLNIAAILNDAMNVYHERRSEINRLYQLHQPAIDSVQAALRREIPLLVQELGLSLNQAAAIDDYANDRVTIFRFLYKNKYSLPRSLSLLLDTLKWRIEKRVHELHRGMFESEFFKAPFCFFHNKDRIGRPVLVIQLSELPDAGDTPLGEYLSSFISFVLEVIRRNMLDISEARVAAGVPDPIMNEALVLIDFKNAKPLPKDPATLKLFITLLKRFPLSAGTVCLLNFGWMYTGLWQMVKILLTEEAKARVSFPKVKELHNLIDDPEFISALEKPHAYPWDISQDTVFQTYGGTPWAAAHTFSRTASSTSISTLYFDTFDTPHTASPYTSSLTYALESTYGTPSGGLTPFSSESYAGDWAVSQAAPPRTPPRLWATFKSLGDLISVKTLPSNSPGVPASLLEERLSALQKQQVSPGDRRNWMYTILIYLVRRFKAIVLRIARKMTKYRREILWMAMCVLFQHGIREFLQSLLVLTAELVADPKQKLSRAAGVRYIVTLALGQMTL